MNDTKSTDVRNLDVNILGRSFRVACPGAEEEGLLEAVNFLDARMREIQSSGKVVGIDRVAVMAALNITHEFLHLRVAPNFDYGEFSQRMTRMGEVLDQVLGEQEQLF